MAPSPPSAETDRWGRRATLEAGPESTGSATISPKPFILNYNLRRWQGRQAAWESN
jgi:hypothetical protein